MAYKTDYYDDILDTSKNTKRKYKMTTNDDGTVSFEDVTEYLTQGDVLGADAVNEFAVGMNKFNAFVNQFSGDRIPISGRTAGLVTNSARDIDFEFSMPLGVKYTKATVENLQMTVRQNGKYIVGSSSSYYNVSGNSNYEITASRRINGIAFQIRAKNAIANAVNNDCCFVMYMATLVLS